MTREESQHAAALEFLCGRINYERTVDMPYQPDVLKLDRMRELLARLGSPQNDMPIVHVAGTKGKGSTSAMLAAILTAAGTKTGVYSSPHLERIEERLAVDGKACSDAEFVELVNHVRPLVEAMDAEDPNGGPTFFELSTASALMHFARSKVDAAVLEVGLGGRLDSTNVCSPELCIITSISLDHTRQLGNTLASIAAEKAGIVKPGVPVLSGVTEDEPRGVIREISQRHGCELIELGQQFEFDYRPAKHLERERAAGEIDFRSLVGGTDYENLELGLPGRHQATNAALAVAAAERLRKAGWNIPESAVRHGLIDVVVPARVDVVSRGPAVIIDTAHNRASIAALVAVLQESFSVARRLLVFAATQEKDLDGMLKCLLPAFDEIVFTKYLENPRAVDPKVLAETAQAISGKAYEHFSTPAEAWAAISQIAGPDDLICITGSFFIAAEMRRAPWVPQRFDKTGLKTL